MTAGLLAVSFFFFFTFLAQGADTRRAMQHTVQKKKELTAEHETTLEEHAKVGAIHGRTDVKMEKLKGAE